MSHFCLYGADNFKSLESDFIKKELKNIKADSATKFSPIQEGKKSNIFDLR